MVAKFRFPKASANVENATLTAWLKREGETVAEGEIVAEITTDKGVIEVEAPVSGTLLEIVAPEGSVLPVGYIMALVGDPAEEIPDVGEENRRILDEAAELAGGPARGGGARQPRTRIRATPAARRLAREHGVDLARLAAQRGAESVDEDMVQAFVDNRDR